jgi:peptidoglycan/LPS O-acetylase OafA/YrhL
LSLLWSLYTVQRDPVADFYSPLTRFWELALGAWLAWWSKGRSPEQEIAIAAPLGWLGLSLIALGLAVINSSDAFPGAWALLPTLGAAFLIQAGPQAQANQALAWRPMVWIGLISYPLYLWHWPLLTYARIIEGETPGATVRWLDTAGTQRRPGLVDLPLCGAPHPCPKPVARADLVPVSDHGGRGGCRVCRQERPWLSAPPRRHDER